MEHLPVSIQASDRSGTFGAYLAVPKSGSGPGLVIAQEIFGVNKTMRDVADSYAEEGYVVLVPDLFWRQQPGVQLGHSADDMQRAFGFYGGFDEAKGVDDIQATLKVLRALPQCNGKAGGGLRRRRHREGDRRDRPGQGPARDARRRARHVLPARGASADRGRRARPPERRALRLSGAGPRVRTRRRRSLRQGRGADGAAAHSGRAEARDRSRVRPGGTVGQALRIRVRDARR